MKVQAPPSPTPSENARPWIPFKEAVEQVRLANGGPVHDFGDDVYWPGDPPPEYYDTLREARAQVINALAVGELDAVAIDGTKRLSVANVNWVAVEAWDIEGLTIYLWRDQVDRFLTKATKPGLAQPPPPRSDMERAARPHLERIERELPGLSQRKCAIELAAAFKGDPIHKPAVETCVGYVRYFRTGK